MADILKITTPLVNKTQSLEPKGDMALKQPFNLQEISKVVKTNPQTELLKQNNGLVEREETSALLMNMLKDPAVTAATLKSIFAMQEMFKLLPMNNRAFTEELEQLFDLLMVSPEDIQGELVRQESETSSFKGELFDFLRGELEQRAGQENLRAAVLGFLKSLTQTVSRKEILGSVANDLEFLSRAVSPSKELSAALKKLAGEFRTERAQQEFPELKKRALALFSELGESILFSPKLEKVVSIALYNLSRFNNNPNYLQEASALLCSQLHGDQKREAFMKLVHSYLQSGGENCRDGKTGSVMDVLAKVLEAQLSNEDVVLVNGEKMEKIIHSLLSSPCNFTPLLHYVIPVQYENTQAFAEVWINPHGKEDDRSRGRDEEEATHMLLVFDVEGIGHLELELYVRQHMVDFSLFCPAAYVEAYSGMEKALRKNTIGTEYQFGEIRFDKLERPRSLMEVFRSLPYKRTGVDVRI